MSPLVSVVIPNFNRAERVAKAIDSVLGQEFTDLELLVIDDCSPQPPESVYRRVLKEGHKVFVMDENSGPGACRNLGAWEAKGEWLAFLDSDDYWLPQKLARHLEALEESGLLIGQTNEIWYRDGARVNPPKAHRISGGDLFKRSLRAVCVSSSTVVLKRELFESLGGFDESIFVCEDYELWLRASCLEQFQHLEEELVVKYGGHSDQLSKALPAMDRFRIWAILKGLNAGQWQSRDDGLELTKKELERKLRILRKGSAKREKNQAVELCIQIDELMKEDRFESAFKLSQELLGCWDVTP